MKSLLLKQGLFISTFLFAAISAAVVRTNSIEEKSLPVVQGFIRGNPEGTICDHPKFCQTEINQWLCRVDDLNPGSTQMYGMVGNRCIATLYRLDL